MQRVNFAHQPPHHQTAQMHLHPAPTQQMHSGVLPVGQQPAQYLLPAHVQPPHMAHIPSNFLMRPGLLCIPITFGHNNSITCQPGTIVFPHTIQTVGNFVVDGVHFMHAANNAHTPIPQQQQPQSAHGSPAGSSGIGSSAENVNHDHQEDSHPASGTAGLNGNDYEHQANVRVAMPHPGQMMPQVQQMYYGQVHHHGMQASGHASGAHSPFEADRLERSVSANNMKDHVGVNGEAGADEVQTDVSRSPSLVNGELSVSLEDEKNKQGEQSEVIGTSWTNGQVEKETQVQSGRDSVVDGGRESEMEKNVTDTAPKVKNWASIVGKITTPVSNVSTSRQAVAPRVEHRNSFSNGSPAARPASPKMNGFDHARKPVNGGGGRPDSGQRRPQQQRKHWEFPKLSTEDARSYPDAQQVFLKDVPQEINSDQIADAFRKYGEVVDVRLRIIREEESQKEKTRNCFVLMRERRDVDSLLSAQSVRVGNHNILVLKKTPTRY